MPAPAADVVLAADACCDAVRVTALQDCGAVACAAVAEVVRQRLAAGMIVFPHMDAVADGRRDLGGALIINGQECAPQLLLWQIL